MNTLEIGSQLVAFCQRGENLKALDTLYSPEAVSQEAVSMPNMPAEVHGIEAIKKKNQMWIDSHEVHSAEVKGPFPHGEQFAVFFKYDITDKQSKKRMTMEEVALYTVRDNKIVKDEFFYVT